MDFPTRQDLFRAARDEVLRLNGQLSRAAVERPGSDANIIINAAVAAAEEVVGSLIDLCSGQFLDSASGEALDRLVFDRYGLVRKQAASALGTVEFTTVVNNPVSFTIPAGTSLSTADGIQFVTTLDTSFAAGSTGPIYVPVRSVLAGADQQAAIGTITSIVSAIGGAPDDLAANNTVATAGADDEEEDSSLRDRGRRFFSSAQRGTIGAIESAALSTPGVNRASAVEVLDSSGRPGRFVQLIVSDRFTDALATLSTSDPSFDAQSQQLAQQVFLNLGEFRPAGTFIQVIVAQVVLQSVQLQLTFNAGVSADAIALQARVVIVNFINELQPGQDFVPADAIDELRNVSGLIITGNEIQSPVGIVSPNPTQVIRATLSIVTAGAVQSSQPVALTTNPDAFIAGNVTTF